MSRLPLTLSCFGDSLSRVWTITPCLLAFILDIAEDVQAGKMCVCVFRAPVTHPALQGVSPRDES